MSQDTLLRYVIQNLELYEFQRDEEPFFFWQVPNRENMNKLGFYYTRNGGVISLILTWDVNVEVTPQTIPLNYPHMRFLRLSYDCPSGGRFRNMTTWDQITSLFTHFYHGAFRWQDGIYIHDATAN
jgi:hypothetical protein